MSCRERDPTQRACYAVGERPRYREPKRLQATSIVWERSERVESGLLVMVCDWLVPTRDLLIDRGMMGDGVIDLTRIRRAVEAVGYDGFAEAEIFSENWWTKPMNEVLDTCIALSYVDLIDGPGMIAQNKIEEAFVANLQHGG
jgi:hypothetical protein